MEKNPINLSQPLVVVALSFIIFSWLVPWFFILLGGISPKGNLSDMFVPILALFSGLAFLGLLYIIRLQQKEFYQYIKNSTELLRQQEAQKHFNTQESRINLYTALLRHYGGELNRLRSVPAYDDWSKDFEYLDNKIKELNDKLLDIYDSLSNWDEVYEKAESLPEMPG